MNKRGFTLLELLVVVLIIGILASIALPQYQMAVTKAKVASMLPLMRRFKDAMAEYKLQHGSYEDLEDTSALGVSWPSDWKQSSNTNNLCGDSLSCKNDYWVCDADQFGKVSCYVNDAGIYMYPPDYDDEDLRDKVTCYSDTSEGIKICKAVGSKEIYNDGGEAEYQL